MRKGKRRRMGVRRLRVALCVALLAAAGGLVAAEPAGLGARPEAARPHFEEAGTVGRAELRRGSARRQQKLRVRHENKRARRAAAVADPLPMPDFTDGRLGILPDAPGGELDPARRGGGR